jgi:hypothetical protein
MLKSSFQNESCAAGLRWAAQRIRVQNDGSRPYFIQYERSLRPCLASTHRTPTTSPILERTPKTERLFDPTLGLDWVHGG